MNVSRKIGMFYVVATMTAAGMFHAATAYLPSTFAMYTTMLGMAAFIDRRHTEGQRTVEGVFWFAIGGLLGWPFSMAMVVPFVTQRLFAGINSSGIGRTIGALIKAAFGALGVLVGSRYPRYIRAMYDINHLRRQLSLLLIPGHTRN